MYQESAGSLSNILLDYLFMYPLDMEIAGAALATAIGPVISVLILLPHFLFRKGYLYFRRERPDADTLKWFLILGASSFVLEFSIGMVTFLMNYGIVRYGFGEEGLAAFAAGRSRLYFAGFFDGNTRLFQRMQQGRRHNIIGNLDIRSFQKLCVMLCNFSVRNNANRFDPTAQEWT